MRVCFIVGEFPALSETFILNQMTGLMDAGCDILIFSAGRSRDTIVHEDVVRHGLLHHTRYPDHASWSWFARFLKFLLIFPFKVWYAPGPLWRSINGLRYGKEAWSLDLFFTTLMFLQAREYDIVVCHQGRHGILGLKMKELGALEGKIVTVFYVEDLADMVKARMSEALQRLFARGDLFLPVSCHARDKLLELGCPGRKVVVHRMGVDVRQFDVSARRRAGEGKLRILSVARLIEKKGLTYALEALPLLGSVAYEYLVIGDGPLRTELEDQVRRLGIMRQVRFLGAQDSGTIRRYLKDADVFLAPSVTSSGGDKEGIPVVLMEAMASGVPVVTTANGAIRELVEDGHTGFLVPERDTAALAAKLRALSLAPENAQAAARAGRVLIEEQFNIVTLNQVLLRLFTRTAYEDGRETPA